MKKLTLIALMSISCIGAIAQTYVQLHPLEYVAVNVHKQKTDGVSWNSPTTGWRIDFGDSTFIYREVPPNVGPEFPLFSDLVNPGDVPVIAGPTGMYATFSIPLGDQYYIMVRKPWPSQKVAKFDTTQIFTGGAGSNYPGVYKYKFFCDLRSEHAEYGILVDRYTGIRKRFGLKDTFEHVFTINAADPTDSLSKRPDRFIILTAKPLPRLPVVAPPISVTPTVEQTLSIRVSPNPIAPRGRVWVRCQESYDRAMCTIYDMLTKQALQYKEFTGATCQLDLLPSITGGVYIIEVQPRGNVPSMVTKLQVLRY